MADLAGMGVRWPNPMDYASRGRSSGLAGVLPSADKIMGAFSAQDEAKRKTDEATKKAETEAAARQKTLETNNTQFAISRELEALKDAKLPASSKAMLYNQRVLPLYQKLGVGLPEINADEWRPQFEKYLAQGNAIVANGGLSEQEKRQHMDALWAEIQTKDPEAAPIVLRLQERMKAERQAEVDRFADLAFRDLSGDIAPEERTELLTRRAMASGSHPNDDASMIQVRQELGIRLAEGYQMALERRQKLSETVGRDARRFAPGPNGQPVEVIAAEPKPKEPKEPATLVERIEQLQSTGKPEDAARADRLLSLQDRTKQAMTINMPKTPPTEFIATAQSTKLAATRLARTVERFDESFVGLLGKAKGLATKFSDIPGIPAFAERKKFANEMIAMTNDVKKFLLGSARTVPELADLARFLPDPDTNLSVAEFKGNFESFIEGFIDVMDVLPGTLSEVGLQKPDFTKERKQLTGALEKLRAGGGAKGDAAGDAAGNLKGLTDDEIMERLRGAAKRGK